MRRRGMSSLWEVMKVFGLDIPNHRGLTNLDLSEYVKRLGIEHFRRGGGGVFMRDTLPKIPLHNECGIVNLNTSDEPGSHWVAYYKDGKRRIYFDSFGQITPMELQRYLKTKEEKGKGVIQRNTDIVQHSNTHVCGHLCLVVLRSLMGGHGSFQDVLNQLNDGYTQGDW